MKAKPARAFFPLIPIGLLLAAIAAAAPQAAPISAAEAINHIGKTRTVCGRVASATWNRSSKHQPTFLNLDRPHPDQLFSIVIWLEARKLFTFAPEERYLNKRICVQGTIQKFRKKAEIAVDRPSQIWIAQAP